MSSSGGNGKKNYSRSEWNDLTIQQRIQAMNETLDDVEASGTAGRNESEEGGAGSVGSREATTTIVDEEDDRTAHSSVSRAGGRDQPQLAQPQQTTRDNYGAKLPTQKNYVHPSTSHSTNAVTNAVATRTPPPPGRNKSSPSKANTSPPSSASKRESVIDIWRKRDTSSEATNVPLSTGSGGAGPNKMPEQQTPTTKSQSQLGSMGAVAPAPSTSQAAWMQNRNNNNSARKQPFNQRPPVGNSSNPTSTPTQPQHHTWESSAATGTPTVATNKSTPPPQYTAPSWAKNNETLPVASTPPISKRPPSAPQSLSISVEPADLTIVQSSSNSTDAQQQQPQGSGTQERPNNVRDFWAQRGLQPISSSPSSDSHHQQQQQQQFHNNKSSANTTPSGGTRTSSPTPSLCSTTSRVSVVDLWKQRSGAAAAAAQSKPNDNNTAQGDNEALVANNDWGRRESYSSSNNLGTNPSKNNPYSSTTTTTDYWKRTLSANTQQQPHQDDPNDCKSEAAPTSPSSAAHASALGRWKKRSSSSPAVAVQDNKEGKIPPKTININNNSRSPRKDPQTPWPNEARQGFEVRAESPSVLHNSGGQVSVTDRWKTRSSSPVVVVASSADRQEAELVANNDTSYDHHQKLQSHASRTPSVLSSSNTASTGPTSQGGSVLDRWKSRSSSPALVVEPRFEPQAPPKTVPTADVPQSEPAVATINSPPVPPILTNATPQGSVLDRWKHRSSTPASTDLGEPKMLRKTPQPQNETRRGQAEAPLLEETAAQVDPSALPSNTKVAASAQSQGSVLNRWKQRASSPAVTGMDEEMNVMKAQQPQQQHWPPKNDAREAQSDKGASSTETSVLNRWKLRSSSPVVTAAAPPAVAEEENVNREVKANEVRPLGSEATHTSVVTRWRRRTGDVDEQGEELSNINNEMNNTNAISGVSPSRASVVDRSVEEEGEVENTTNNGIDKVIQSEQESPKRGSVADRWNRRSGAGTPSAEEPIVGSQRHEATKSVVTSGPKNRNRLTPFIQAIASNDNGQNNGAPPPLDNMKRQHPPRSRTPPPRHPVVVMPDVENRESLSPSSLAEDEKSDKDTGTVIVDARLPLRNTATTSIPPRSATLSMDVTKISPQPNSSGHKVNASIAERMAHLQQSPFFNNSDAADDAQPPTPEASPRRPAPTMRDRNTNNSMSIADHVTRLQKPPESKADEASRAGAQEDPAPPYQPGTSTSSSSSSLAPPPSRGRVTDRWTNNTRTPENSSNASSNAETEVSKSASHDIQRGLQIPTLMTREEDTGVVGGDMFESSSHSKRGRVTDRWPLARGNNNNQGGESSCNSNDSSIGNDKKDEVENQGDSFINQDEAAGTAQKKKTAKITDRWKMASAGCSENSSSKDFVQPSTSRGGKITGRWTAATATVTSNNVDTMVEDKTDEMTEEENEQGVSPSRLHVNGLPDVVPRSQSENMESKRGELRSQQDGENSHAEQSGGQPPIAAQKEGRRPPESSESNMALDEQKKLDHGATTLLPSSIVDDVMGTEANGETESESNENNDASSSSRNPGGVNQPRCQVMMETKEGSNESMKSAVDRSFPSISEVQGENTAVQQPRSNAISTQIDHKEKTALTDESEGRIDGFKTDSDAPRPTSPITSPKGTYDELKKKVSGRNQVQHHAAYGGPLWRQKSKMARLSKNLAKKHQQEGTVNPEKPSTNISVETATTQDTATTVEESLTAPSSGSNTSMPRRNGATGGNAANASKSRSNRLPEDRPVVTSAGPLSLPQPKRKESKGAAEPSLNPRDQFNNYLAESKKPSYATTPPSSPTPKARGYSFLPRVSSRSNKSSLSTSVSPNKNSPPRNPIQTQSTTLKPDNSPPRPRTRSPMPTQTPPKPGHKAANAIRSRTPSPIPSTPQERETKWNESHPGRSMGSPLTPPRKETTMAAILSPPQFTQPSKMNVADVRLLPKFASPTPQKRDAKMPRTPPRTSSSLTAMDQKKRAMIPVAAPSPGKKLASTASVDNSGGKEGHSYSYPTLPTPERKKTKGPLDKYLLVLISSQSLSRDQVAIQQQVEAILKAQHIPYEEIDGAIRPNRERRNELFNLSGIWAKYPQFFVVSGKHTTFWGDWEKLQERNENGTFLESFLFPSTQRPHNSERPVSPVPPSNVTLVPRGTPEMPNIVQSVRDGSKDIAPAKTMKASLTRAAKIPCKQYAPPFGTPVKSSVSSAFDSWASKSNGGEVTELIASSPSRPVPRTRVLGRRHAARRSDDDSYTDQISVEANQVSAPSSTDNSPPRTIVAPRSQQKRASNEEKKGMRPIQSYAPLENARVTTVGKSASEEDTAGVTVEVKEREQDRSSGRGFSYNLVAQKKFAAKSLVGHSSTKNKTENQEAQTSRQNPTGMGEDVRAPLTKKAGRESGSRQLSTSVSKVASQRLFARKRELQAHRQQPKLSSRRTVETASSANDITSEGTQTTQRDSPPEEEGLSRIDELPSQATEQEAEKAEVLPPAPKLALTVMPESNEDQVSGEPRLSFGDGHRSTFTKPTIGTDLLEPGLSSFNSAAPGNCSRHVATRLSGGNVDDDETPAELKLSRFGIVASPEDVSSPLSEKEHSICKQGDTPMTTGDLETPVSEGRRFSFASGDVRAFDIRSLSGMSKASSIASRAERVLKQRRERAQRKEPRQDSSPDHHESSEKKVHYVRRTENREQDPPQDLQVDHAPRKQREFDEFDAVISQKPASTPVVERVGLASRYQTSSRFMGNIDGQSLANNEAPQENSTFDYRNETSASDMRTSRLHDQNDVRPDASGTSSKVGRSSRHQSAGVHAGSQHTRPNRYVNAKGSDSKMTPRYDGMNEDEEDATYNTYRSDKHNTFNIGDVVAGLAGEVTSVLSFKGFNSKSPERKGNSSSHEKKEKRRRSKELHNKNTVSPDIMQFGAEQEEVAIEIEYIKDSGRR